MFTIYDRINAVKPSCYGYWFKNIACEHLSFPAQALTWFVNAKYRWYAMKTWNNRK